MNSEINGGGGRGRERVLRGGKLGGGLGGAGGSADPEKGCWGGHLGGLKVPGRASAPPTLGIPRGTGAGGGCWGQSPVLAPLCRSPEGPGGGRGGTHLPIIVECCWTAASRSLSRMVHSPIAVHPEAEAKARAAAAAAAAERDPGPGRPPRGGRPPHGWPGCLAGRAAPGSQPGRAGASSGRAGGRLGERSPGRGRLPSPAARPPPALK